MLTSTPMTVGAETDVDKARAHRNDAKFDGSRLACVLLDGAPTSTLAEFVHDQFRALVLNPRFPCVGAKAAISKNTYRFALYPELGTPDAAMNLARDLRAFVAEQPMLGDYSPFIACFTGPVVAEEKEFKSLLRHQLQDLLDHDTSDWDPTVSSKPSDAGYALSFAGRAFILVELHAASPRWALRFAWPTLVFNAKYLFDRLQQQGKSDRFRQVIRQRDIALQGDINPALKSLPGSG